MNLKVRLTALVLCAAMGVSLYGCRYSSVLEQIIYEMTKSNDIEDQYFYPEQNVEDSDNNTEDLVPIDEDETNRTRDEVMNLPTDEEENSDRGAQLKYDENASSNQNTSRHSSNSTQNGTTGSGTNSTTATTNGTGNSTRGDTTASNGIANNNGTEGSNKVMESDQEGSGTAGYGESGSSYEPTTNADPDDPHLAGGSGGSGEGSTGGGEEQDLPVAGTVAAVGSVALMVMMLTGTEDNPTGALVATNENLINSASANQVFPGLSRLECAWSGDGTQHVDLDIVEESQAYIVAYEGTNNFATVEQESDINNMYADITGTNENHILILDDMASSQGNGNVETNMKTLAQTLSDLYPEAESRAEDYINWSKDVQDFAGRPSTVDWANSQTLYVDGWDANVQYSMTERISGVQDVRYKGSGCAFISSSGTPLGKSVTNYMAIGGVIDVIHQANDSYSKLKCYYVPVSPSSNGSWAASSQTSETLDDFYNNSNIGFWFTRKGWSKWNISADTENLGLGNPGFKILVAGDIGTLEGIRNESTPTLDGEGGSWAVYGYAQANSEMHTDHGFISAGGSLMDSYIYDDYTVVVNPCGLISDWVTAGPESILESAWVAYKLRGVGSYEEVADLVERFYSVLCRYQIQDEEIDGILMDDEYHTYTVTGS